MNNTPHTNCLTLRLLHAAKGYKAVAFDIFDTLLKRDCAHPADLFALMEVTHQAALGFAGARAAAEAETRQFMHILPCGVLTPLQSAQRNWL